MIPAIDDQLMAEPAWADKGKKDDGQRGGESTGECSRVFKPVENEGDRNQKAEQP